MEPVVFPVHVDAGEVAAFRSALGFAAGESPEVPPTFPVRFLASPRAREALESFLRKTTGRVPIHLAQAFEYVRPLRVDETLICRVAIEPDAKATNVVRLIVLLRTADGEPVCEARSDVALVDPSTLPVAAPGSA